MKRLASALLLSVLAAACMDIAPPTAVPLDGTLPAQAVGQLDRVIVVFRDDVADPQGLALGLVNANGGSLGHVYTRALRGFSASLPPQALQGIRNNPNVVLVEPDGVATATATQSGATWGIDRIDSPSGIDSFYNYDFDGSGVTVYVLDTGIRITHSDFGGRASYGPDFVDNDPISQDCHGHGTHVAGTVGSATYGVAKNVNLEAVRVLGCGGSGSYSGIIAAIDYVTGEPGPRVINMSLSGGASASVNAAVNNSVAQGVVHAVAAGNANANACNSSPASATDALTVGSTTSSDGRSSFSNFGTCLDIFAPGSSIRSTDFNSDVANSVKSGTSMASPHVAGVAALYMQEHPGASAYTVNAGITGEATPGAVSTVGSGSPNLLLYSLGDGGEPPPPPALIDAEVGSHTVSTSGRNRKRGISDVQVVELETSQGVPGVTVTGAWTGDYTGSGSGVTDSNGDLRLQTPNIRGASSFTFCVTGLSGTTVNDSAADDCASSGGSPPEPPPSAGPPDNLSVVWKTKGKARADLSWTGGAATVDLVEDGDRRTISNNHSLRDNTPGDSYMVCTVGETTPEHCTDEVSR